MLQYMIFLFIYLQFMCFYFYQINKKKKLIQKRDKRPRIPLESNTSRKRAKKGA